MNVIWQLVFDSNSQGIATRVSNDSNGGGMDFSQKPSTLFKGYIDTFLKIKQEASGWPDWCDAEEKKQQYIQDYQTKEGITLDYNNIKKNPGLRSLAKLMLNSFCE